MSIPESVYIPDAESVFVVCLQKEWTQEGIEELKVDLQKRTVSFGIQGLYPFMLACQRNQDFPLKDWRLVQVGEQNAVLSILSFLLHLSKLKEGFLYRLI